MQFQLPVQTVYNDGELTVELYFNLINSCYKMLLEMTVDPLIHYLTFHGISG